MSLLPKKLTWDLASDRWATILNPFISNPSNNSSILKNISLVMGTNVINHRLGRSLQGWNPTRIRSSVTLYDLQDINQTPQLTLILVASAPSVIDLQVF